ncbi:hypothetical protein BD626DRAFT_390695 [Schizophyllum amplum]|uniref:Protein-S-isoprenylcysteine O-methyltransferase n=1 Tax=Schizophyllum amplum TaxID=97359 RepID=A0A550CYW4_9AGAR|nr:hypothetical protein BD626DRAFT_390695 [Auriculariopsis ampla]
MTPPTPPPPPGERYEVTGNLVERHIIPYMGVLRVSHRVIHNALWISGLVEAVTILAGNFPDAPFASWVLDTFLPADGLQRLRITTPFLIGWGMNLVGSLIRVHCYRKLDRAFTFELAVQKEQKLVTDGAYGIVRHPSYTGGLLAGLGCFMTQLSSGCWLHEYIGIMPATPLGTTIFWVALVVPGLYGFASRIKSEDEMLKKGFGKQWEEWVTRVPYKLIPGVL